MRLFEIVIIVLMSLLSIQTFLPSSLGNFDRKMVLGWIGIMLGVLVPVHALIEGLRWQMIPVYLLTLVFVIRSILQLKNIYQVEVSSPLKGPPRRRTVITLLVLTVVVSASTLYLDNLLPVFILPSPTGEFAVGTTMFDLTDQTREETFTTDSSDNRRILIQAWYPAEDVTGLNIASYVYNPSAFGTGVERSWGFPALIVSHFPLVKTHSYENAPLSEAESEFPVLFFSHGYGGVVMQNTVLMEELASHGYIVFSIGHPYESFVTAYPDGTVVYETDASDLPTFLELDNSLEIWANDTLFLLDQLEIADNPEIPDIFWDSLDFTRIGAFGHSFGGMTAEQVCLADARIHVGVSLDSPHFGLALELNMTKPYMLMFGPDYGNPQMNDTVYANSENTCYGLYINGTRHHNFADVNLWSSLLKSFGLLGSIEGYRMLEILTRYVLAFFDTHLMGDASTLLDGPLSSYPEVTFHKKP
ncbi:MAG: alpha/beta hydrolase family protein [Candidatus Thorarchaeota archaeon]